MTRYSDIISSPPLSFCPILDQIEGDEDEPDLSLLSTLDFAALKDVWETGADYCHNFKHLLHTTPSLKPGYLPQADSLRLLTGVSISCYEDSQIPK